MVNLPVFVEPVVGLSLDVERIAEVGRARRGNPELLGLVDQQIVDELLVLALVVFLHDTEAANRRA
jgi:hypothetical protein